VDGQFRLGRNHRIGFRVMASDLLALGGERQSGTLLDFDFRAEGRNLRYGASHFAIEPEFATEVGFVRRVDTRQTDAHLEYRWWPERLVQDWGPRLEYSRNHDFAGILQDEDLRLDLAVQFAGNVDINGGISRRMERYAGIDFRQTRLSLGGRIDSSRHVSIGAFFNTGDQIRFIDNPFLGRGTRFNTFITVRPWPRLMSAIDINTSRLIDPRTGAKEFDVKIFRTLTTFQFTNRLLARNIVEVNTFDKTVAFNLLATYRVNAGTVFYVGYDDHYQHGTTIEDFARPDRRYHRTNRAIFTKLQYLFRY
jgi:hypothetical protein